MTISLPKLLPVSVPWMVSPSVPVLKLHFQSDGSPSAVTFVGYFKCDDSTQASAAPGGAVVVQEDITFTPSSTELKGPFRMVKVNFENGVRGRVMVAHSDIEVIAESEFDWSEVAGARRPGESPSSSVARAKDLWLSTRICPNPRMYEVLGSAWIEECGFSASEGWRHYILVGHDEYVEAIATDWSWEPGQVVA